MLLLLPHLARTAYKGLRMQGRFLSVPGLGLPSVQSEQCFLLLVKQEDGTDSCYGGWRGRRERRHVVGEVEAQAVYAGGWAHLYRQWLLCGVDGGVCECHLQHLLATVAQEV